MANPLTLDSNPGKNMCTSLRPYFAQNNKRFAAGALLLLSVLCPALARAQEGTAKAAVAPLLYADQMPALPGGGGNAAVAAALQKNFKYPKPTSATPIAGRVVVSLIVEADGSIREAKVVKSPRPDCETAVVAAALKLPRFVPGRHNGQSVPVVITVPLSVLIDPVAPASATATARP